MSDVASLIARLREDPEDTPSWLVYADWLTDRGDVRGELIALERRLAEGSQPPSERRALLSRIGAIRSAHQDSWSEGLRPLPGWTLRWRHGFVVGLETYWTESAEKRLSELLAHESAALLSVLSLTGITGKLWKPKRLLGLASGIWRVFSRIAIDGYPLDDKSLAALVDPARDTPLVSLGLYLVDPDVLVQLIRRAGLGRLKELSLRGHPSEDLAAEIGRTESLASLERLSFRRMSLSQDSLRAILASKTLRSLTALDVSEARPAPEALAGSELALRELALCADEDGAFGALDSERFSGLRSLSLEGTALDEHALRTLADSKHLRSIEHLSLSMPAPCFGAILDRAALPLRTLEIRGANLGDDGASRLASAEGARRLRRLALDANDIRETGARALASSEQLSSLAALSLPYNSLGDAGALEIARSEHLALSELDLRGNEIGETGKKALEKALFGCTIALD